MKEIDNIQSSRNAMLEARKDWLSSSKNYRKTVKANVTKLKAKGYSQREIAKAIGVSESTLRKLIK